MPETLYEHAGGDDGLHPIRQVPHWNWPGG